VAKCWDANPKSYFTIPRAEPIRPIDPGAWVAHTNALRNGELAPPSDFPAPLPLPLPPPSSASTTTSNKSGSQASTVQEMESRAWMDLYNAVYTTVYLSICRI